MDIISDLKNIIQSGIVSENEMMKNHTTLKIGGPARYFVSVANEQELKELLDYLGDKKIKYFLVGNGSNLLVPDEGYEGVVIKLDDDFKVCFAEIEKGDASNKEGITLEAGAGALLSVVANKAMEKSLTGMEFASGIPGSVGGAIIMNAGAYDGEMKDIVKSVSVLEKNSENGKFEFKTYSNEEMQFSYRNSIAKQREMVVISVCLALHPGNKEEIKKTMDELNAKRREKQPLEYPSAGSTFKRPEGYFAGKLISDAGLKGYHVGDAEVSEKHAGFCINKGNATATEFIKLMNDVSMAVKEKYDVELEPEVIILK